MIDKSYNVERDIFRVNSLHEDGGISISKEANKLITNMKNYLESKHFLEVINTGMEALNYEQFNLEIYYMICKAAENEKKYYELKWSALVGMIYACYNSDYEYAYVFDKPASEQCSYNDYFYLSRNYRTYKE